MVWKSKILLAFAIFLVLVSTAPQDAFATRHSPLELFSSSNATHPLGTLRDVKYPMYKQCDPTWGSDLIYTKTVCQVGCLMSSISMGLHGWDLNIGGEPSNPGTLNEWLKENNGYTQGNNLIESALNQVFRNMWTEAGMHKTNDLTPYELSDLINSDKFVVANVMKGRHFVLVTNWSEKNPDIVWVNDPGFNTEYYSFSNDIVGWRVFDVNNFLHEA